MTRFVLSPLGDALQLAPPETPGQWQSSNQYRLDNLAGSLRISRQEGDADQLVSIPDPWAQVETFRQALITEKHPLHQGAVAEWRGLIALFALAPYYGYSIKTDVLRIADLVERPYQSRPDGNPDRSGSLAAVLQKLLPTMTLTDQHLWEELAVIGVGGETIGMLVPSVLVCPARHYVGGGLANLPWTTARGRLGDPLAADALQGEQLLALADMAQRLRHAIEDAAGRANSLTAGMYRELDRLASEARNAAVHRGVDEHEVERKEEILPCTVPEQPGFSVLVRPSQISLGGRIRSDCRLKLRADVDTGIDVILLDYRIAGTLGRAAARVRLWNHISLDRLDTQAIDRRGLAAEIAAAGALLITRDEVLLPKISRLEGGAAAAHAGTARGFILPIAPTLLLVYSADQLRQRIQVEETDTGVRVVLTLPLITRDGTVINHTIDRSYDADTGIVRVGLPEVLTTWPDFKAPEWPWHFLFYGGSPLSFRVDRTFSPDLANAKLAGIDDPAARARAAHDLLEGTRKPERADLSSGAQDIIFWVEQIGRAPEALICHGSDDGSGRERVAGVMLMPPIPAAPAAGAACRLGIDFGTTNTSVYLRRGDEPPEPAIFRNRNVSALEVANPERMNALLDEGLPYRDLDVPFMTCLRERNPGQGDQPVGNYSITVTSDPDTLIKELKSRSNIVFDLKWSTDPNNNRRVVAFLSQVALMALAEAVAQGADAGSVEWHFSHPEAFTPRRLNDFQRSIQLAVHRIVNPIRSRGHTVIDRRTESLAAALYFADRRLASFTETVATLDIGGHTSDLSIWQNRRLVWRNSVELAGRHIFTAFLQHNPDVLIQLLSGRMDTSIDSLEGLDGARLKNAIEVVINSETFRRQMPEALAILGQTKYGQRLQAVAEFGLAGLMDYLGQIAASLIAEGKLSERDGGRATLCLGGRTSMLYKELFPGAHGLDALGRLMSRPDGTGIRPTRISFTDQPKHEVAYGLLVDPRGATDLVIDTADRRALVGEPVLQGDQSVAPGTPVNALEIGVDWRIEETPTLDAFLRRLDGEIGLRATLNDADRERIRSAVNSGLADAQAEIREDAGGTKPSPALSAEATAVEAPYIVALRETLSLLISRADALSIRG